MPLTVDESGPSPAAAERTTPAALAWPRPVPLLAGVVAVALAVVGRGDAVVLAALVALAAGTGPGALAGAGAVVATALRWGTTSLAAVVGAQAVLGPAVTVGPMVAAAGSAMAVVGALLGSVLGRRGAWMAVAAVAPLALSTGQATTGSGLRAIVALASVAVAAMVGRLLPVRRGPAVAWAGVVLAAAGAGLCR